MADNALVEDWYAAAAAGIVFGALAAVMVLRRVLTKEAQYDPRFILLVLGAVTLSAVAGILVGLLLRPN